MAHETFGLFTCYDLHQRCTPISGGRELRDRAAAARIPLTGTPDTDFSFLFFFFKQSARARDPYYKLGGSGGHVSAATGESLLETQAPARSRAGAPSNQRADEGDGGLC